MARIMYCTAVKRIGESSSSRPNINQSLVLGRWSLAILRRCMGYLDCKSSADAETRISVTKVTRKARTAQLASVVANDQRPFLACPELSEGTNDALTPAASA